MVEDTKEIIRSRMLKEESQYNDHNKQYKRTNKDL